MSDLEKRITAKMVLDDSGYSSTLKGINSELKNNKAALRAATSGLEAFGKSEEGALKVEEKLKRQLELQAKKVSLYKDLIEKASNKMQENIKIRNELKSSLESNKKELDKLIKVQSNGLKAYRENENALEKLNSSYEKASKKYGENSKEANKLKEEISKLKTEQDKLISNNQEEISSYKKVKSELDKTSKTHEKTSKSVEDSARKIQNYESNLNKAQDQVNKAKIAVNKFNHELENVQGLKSASKRLQATGDKFQKFGEKASSLGSTLSTHVSLPLAGIAVAAGHVGMEFESNMSRVQAISGATGDEFKKLENEALDLGAKTSFSANECAQGMENLSSAGFSVNETMESMPGLLDLAASSGEDLGQSSDIAASTLRGFGLEASQAGHMADVLAKNAADTNAAVSDTGEAMKYAAAPAHALGLSLEEVTASIGIMSDAGIKGTQAGTTLRGALTRLAKPSGEAAKTMKKIGFNAFDAQGKMLPLNQIIGNLEKSTQGLTDKQKQQTIASIFGQEAMSGMLVLMGAGPEKIDSLTNSLKNSDGAAKKMADTMQNNTKASVEQALGALETAGIKALKAAAPGIEKVAKAIGNLADKFSQLSPETQGMILKLGLLAMASGPVISGIGTVSKGLGGVFKIGSKLSSLIGGASTVAEGAAAATTTVETALEGTAIAAGGATTATGGLIATLGTVVLPIAGAVAGLGSVAYGGYKVYEALNSSATPAVDLFADKVERSGKKLTNAHTVYKADMDNTVTKISEGTKKAVGAYMELDSKASNSLMDLRIKSGAISKKQSDDLIKIYEGMGNKIKSGLDKKYNEQEKSMSDFFAKSKALSTKEEADILNKTKANWNKKKQTIDGYQKQITDIINKASNEHRQITDGEAQTISQIQKKMKETAVKTLSANEVETKVILERMKDYDNNITAQQASEHIKKLNEIRDKSVNSAKSECDNRIAQIIKMRDESKVISADQANKLIADAKKQRDETIKAAESTRNGAVNKITSMNSSIKENVNTTTGEVKSNWDKLKSWWDNWHPVKKIFSFFTQDESKAPKANWTGNSYFKGGYTTLHERGYELYDLPSGTRIYNHDASEEMIKKTARDVASQLSSKGKGDINLTQNIYSPVPSPSELQRQSMNGLKELSLRLDF